jgi:O-antigen/teichoic acid export membrane protein
MDATMSSRGRCRHLLVVHDIGERAEFNMLNVSINPASLKWRVLGAGAWSLAGFALSYTIRLGSSLLMTRLLVPQMFGVMVIASTVMTGLAMFSDLGLQQNIVQSRRGTESAYLNTAWVIQIVRGLLLWLLALCVSLLIFTANHLGWVPKASVYADPYLPYVIAVISISAIISGFQSTKLSEASRRLALRRVVQIQITGQIIGVLCMIGWVSIERSIWALVVGAISSTASTTLLSHIWLPGVANRLQWDKSAFDEIFHFGKWIFLSSILGFFANNADSILLGVFLDSATLGIYSIASIMFNSIIQILNKIFSDVSFPALSEVARERLPDLKRNLYRFHVVAASLTYFCAGLLFVSGSTLVSLLYDRRYGQAGWMLEVLAVALLAVPFNQAQWCLLALGLPKFFMNVIALRVAVTVALIPLGFHFFGIVGAVWAIAISQLAHLPATIYYQLKYELFDLPMELLLLPISGVGMAVGKGFNFFIVH